MIKTYLKCFALREKISFAKQTMKRTIKVLAVIYIASKKSLYVSLFVFSVN